MKHNIKIFKRYAPWLVLLLSVDGLSYLLLWISAPKAFKVLVTVIVFATVLLFGIVFGFILNRDRRREQAFLDFLSNPDEYGEERMLKLVSDAEGEMIRILGTLLRDKQNSYQQLLARISDYEEYVEAWAHETKTPISLLTLLLDNRRDELPENVGFKLDYIRNRMQEYVNQMLFYARLKGVRKDYLFENVSLNDCMEEVLDDYRPLLEEKHFQIKINTLESHVYTDRRGVTFLISQIISNAVKYCNVENVPEMFIETYKTDQNDVLIIKDNGSGMHICDLPYIFEKGFTGDSGSNRRKATGMGLYLANEVANNLNISLEAKSEWEKGFEMKITFPIVKQTYVRGYL